MQFLQINDRNEAKFETNYYSLRFGYLFGLPGLANIILWLVIFWNCESIWLVDCQGGYFPFIISVYIRNENSAQIFIFILIIFYVTDREKFLEFFLTFKIKF